MTAPSPKTITIDFGEGCEGPRGFTRSGIITITITDTLRNPGAEYQATFDNFAYRGFFGNRNQIG